MGKDKQIDLLTEADELLTKIEATEQRCQVYAVDVQNCQEQLKTAKEVYAGAVAELRGLARVRKEEHPLFDAAAKATGVPEMLRLNETAKKVNATFSVVSAETADDADADEPSANSDDQAKQIRRLHKAERRVRKVLSGK